MSKTRRLKPPTYKHFRLQKRLKQPQKPLTASLKLFKASLQQLWDNKRVFGGLILIYGLLSLLFVKGFSSSINLSELKKALSDVVGGGFNTTLTLFSFLITNTTASSEAGSVYQSSLAIIVSLALVWVLRQISAGKKTTAKEAFYKGIYPLVPFVIVLLILGVQLLPFLVGSSVFNLVINNGIASAALEKITWALLFGLLTILSFYMLSSSVFGLYIVTLPDMTPLKALRSARQLVLYRRAMVLRRLIMLPILLLISALIIMLPIIYFVPAAAEWLFFVLSLLGLAVVHTYIYNLYRELL